MPKSHKHGTVANRRTDVTITAVRDCLRDGFNQQDLVHPPNDGIKLRIAGVEERRNHKQADLERRFDWAPVVSVRPPYGIALLGASKPRLQVCSKGANVKSPSPF